MIKVSYGCWWDVILEHSNSEAEFIYEGLDQILTNFETVFALVKAEREYGCQVGLLLKELPRGHAIFFY